MLAPVDADFNAWKDLASPAGFEPTAPGLGILCSILLSYGDVRRLYLIRTAG